MSLLYRNTFPEYLQAVAIGPDPSFMEKNTTNCELVSAFPKEVELMYDWKNLRLSSDPLNKLRDFTKKFTMYGPELDVQTIRFFVRKVKNYPEYYSAKILDEIAKSFVEAGKINRPKTQPSTTFTYGKPIHEDNSFVNSLAAKMKACNSPCNYFQPSSDVIGTLVDLGRSLTGSSSVASLVKGATPAPIGIGMNIYNKIIPSVRSEFVKLKSLSENALKQGVSAFFPKEPPQNQLPPDVSGERAPLTNDTNSSYAKSEAYSEVQAAVKAKLGDCYRLHDDSARYNPYDPEMNLAYSKRKFMGISNGYAKSLVDILGGNAPAHHASENTYKSGLDVPSGPDARMYDDSPVAPKYDSYERTSGGQKATQEIVGGNANSVAPAAGGNPSGGGLDNIPPNGKTMVFQPGEIYFTRYGYVGELAVSKTGKPLGNPDSGSFIGLGNRGNMIVPLRTVALPPNIAKERGFKSGDVLIIEITTNSGEKFTERRQYGDVSENKPYLNIDEFLPEGTKSRLVALKDKSYKATITIADTKEPLPKYNPAEASNFAAMYLSKNCWDYVLRKNNQKDFGVHLRKMPTEYIKFVKWGNTA